MLEEDRSNVVVRAEHFSYSHPDTTEPTLKDINFEVRKGEFVLLAGPSGCGKSTLALCMMGIRPGLLLGRATGDLLVNGHSSLTRPAHHISREMNIVFQSPDDQISNLTAEDEIVFGLENLQSPLSAMRTKLAEVLDVCRMEGLRHRQVWQLSGGEKQRVAMASILALEPPILLLDEPTSNLDPKGAQEVWDTVGRIRQRYNSTIILVQHNIDSVLPKVDRVILMEHGTISFDGSPEELILHFGWKLRNEWGLWLPQATEIGLYLEDKGERLEHMPLGTEEAEPALRRYCSCFRLNHRNGKDGLVPQDHFECFDLQPDPVEERPKRTAATWLNVQDIRFRYRKDMPEVLKGISLDVEQGEMLFILGPNGAGKSTLAMQLIGLLKPSEGRIMINGQDTRPLSPAELARKIAYVFQYPEHQFIANSVYQEVTHGPLALKWPADRVAQKAETLLRSIGLWECRERHPFNLSMGQKRRLSVACMLITEPQAIILDEPTFGQDWRNATELMRYLQELNHVGTTVMCITHDMRLVAEYARRAIVVAEGTIIFDGPPQRLFATKEVLSTASLETPPVFGIAEQLLGRGALFSAEFCAALEGVPIPAWCSLRSRVCNVEYCSVLDGVRS